MASKKSSKPSNLTGSLDIVRFRTPPEKSGHIQYLELKITWNPPQNCTDQDYYLTYNGAKPPKKKKDLTNAQRSLTFEINAEKYYPTKTSTPLTSITFGISAKQKKKKNRSDFNKKIFHFVAPGEPIAQSPQPDSNHDSCIFSWSQNPNDGDVERRKNLYFTFLDDFEWETTLTDSHSDPTDEQWKTGKESDVTIHDSTTGMPVTHVGHGSLTSTRIKIYENQDTINNALYRHVRVRARGPAGPSNWVHTYYRYGTSARVSIVPGSARITEKTSDKTAGTQDITIDANGASNFDILCQYAIVTPRVTTSIEDGKRISNMRLPIDFDNWDTYKTITGRTATNVNASFVAPALEDDQVIFIRNVVSQNGQSVPTDPMFLESSYTLPTPTIGVTDLVPESHRATITIGGTRSTITEAYTAIYFKTRSISQRVIAIADNQTSSLTVQAPDWGDETPEFGVQAFIGSYTPVGSSATEYNILSSYMSSRIDWDEGQVPTRPTNVTLERIREGVLQVTFNWEWTAANQAEISWSQDPDAWISTSGPETFVISNTHSGVWNIAGLSAGTWYVKVRLIRSVDDSTTYSMYSDRAEMSMSAAPDTPSLHISGGNPSSATSTYAGIDETLTAFWAYKSNDGTNQREAIFAEATMVDGSWTFTEIPDKSVEAATSFSFTPAEMGWTNDSTHHLSVRLRSMSDILTDNWSAPVTIVVASKPSIELDDIGDSGDSIVEVDGKYELAKFPLEFEINGGDTSWTSTVTIERAQSTDPKRPDDTADTRFAGEAVYVNTFPNSGSSTTVSIPVDDPHYIGVFDQGTPYILRVVSKDSYGQVSEPQIVEFTVNWDHKAIEPICTVEFDHAYNVAFITPTAPEGAIIGNEGEPSDTCDIYRYSVDGLTCIAEGLDFGTKYVDKYPTLGLFGGYRIVFRTLYGDYKTDTDDFAWINFGPYETEDEVVSNNGDYIKQFATIIDFGGNTLTINGDITTSDSWKKDFQLTRYLGGSMIGDWNPGVERSGSQTATIPVKEEAESISLLRELAEYSGQCRIRTPEGSNYFANIEVKDDRESKWVNKISKVNLTINRVDAEDDEVITYAKWEEEIAE